MKIRRPTSSGPSLKRPIPLSLSLTLFCCLAAVAAAYLENTGSFSLALGDALVIAALVMFAIAWIGYLKKDGIRFFHPGKSARTNAAESWKDRIPSIGESPTPPLAIPGAEGPDAADYQRLAVAEGQLRKKILGIDKNEADGKEYKAKDPGFIGSAAIAGLILLILALFFEYLVPLLLR